MNQQPDQIPALLSRIAQHNRIPPCAQRLDQGLWQAGKVFIGNGLHHFNLVAGHL